MTPETDYTEHIVEKHDPRIALCQWQPIVEDSDIPTPETHSLQVTRSEDGVPEWDTDEAVDIVKWFRGEAFVRSDFKSASNVDRGSHIFTSERDHVEMTLKELTASHSMMQMPLGKYLHFREWLDLEWVAYGSRYTYHPEIRFFLRDGEVTCYHLRSEFGQHEEFKSKARQYIEPDNGFFDSITEEVHSYAESLADELAAHADIWYSADFVLTTDREWYLTDMAVDALYESHKGIIGVSSHPDDCDHNIEHMFADQIPDEKTPESDDQSDTDSGTANDLS